MKHIILLIFIVLPLFHGKLLAYSIDVSATNTDTASAVVGIQLPDSAKLTIDTTQIEDIHPQDSPEKQGFLIVTRDGKDQLRLRGSIRLNGAYDFNGLQSQDLFATHEIPVGEDNRAEPRFFMSANQTRIGLDALTNTQIGEVFMRIEGDFRGITNAFRLRHAYGTSGPLIAGQTWSTFGDVSSLPWTVDLDGPNSAVSERTIQIRYTQNVSDDFRWAVAIESPTAEISLPDTLQAKPAFQSFPDIIGRIRKFGDWGHLQIAGVLRSITVRDVAGGLQYLAGYGGLLSGGMNLTKEDEILFQAFYGDAIARYIGAITGRGLDVIYNATNQNFETVTTFGGFLSYAHDWNTELYSYFTAGLTDIRNRDFEPPDAFNYSQYVSANIFWEATEEVRAGIEYSFGRRVNKNDDTGTANRLSFIMYYDF